MTELAFIRPPYPVSLLVAEHVTEILPKLSEAARSTSGAEEEVTPAVAERM